jgi:hypothetical protein
MSMATDVDAAFRDFATAIAIEAHAGGARADDRETGRGAKHESAGPKDIAQQHPNEYPHP